MGWLGKLFGGGRRAGPGGADFGAAPEAAASRMAHCLAHKRKGNECLAAGQPAEAEACYRAALALCPEYAEGYVNLGYALLSRGQPEEAAAVLERGLALDPGLVDAHFLLGRMAAAGGDAETASRHLEAAVQGRPDFVEALELLARLERERARRLRAGGQEALARAALDQVERRWREALAAAPETAALHAGLGYNLAEKGLYPAAEASLAAAVARDPGLAGAWHVLGTLASALGQTDAAVERFEKAMALQPNFVESLDCLGFLYGKLGLYARSLDCYRRQIAIDSRLHYAHSNFLTMLLYDPETPPAALFAEQRRFAEVFEAPLKPGWRPHGNDRDPERRLRVGYVSPDFREHSVAFFLLPVLQGHDPDRFEIVCYHDSEVADGYTARIKELAHRFEPVFGLDDEALAARVRAEGIDILVDLTGHFGKNRMLTFARKPAPVQVTWIGHPSSTGLNAMDYRLTDGEMDPVGLTEAFHTEQLVRLPLMAPFEPAPDSPPVNALPALGTGQVTFSCLNNLLKLNGRVIALWARILAELPASRLLLGNVDTPRTRAELLAAFGRAGVDPGRLVLLPKLPIREFLRVHGEIDLALDPFPFNGGTITLHSLWMGVPVVSLEGGHAVGRWGVTLMNAVGFPEFVARTEAGYVETALALACDLPRLDGVRQALRGRLAARLNQSAADLPLVRHVENAYRAMWREWVRQGT